MACRTASLTPAADTAMSPPRSTGLAISSQRMASEPYVSNTSFTSG